MLKFDKTIGKQNIMDDCNYIKVLGKEILKEKSKKEIQNNADKNTCNNTKLIVELKYLFTPTKFLSS